MVPSCLGIGKTGEALQRYLIKFCLYRGVLALPNAIRRGSCCGESVNFPIMILKSRPERISTKPLAAVMLRRCNSAGFGSQKRETFLERIA